MAARRSKAAPSNVRLGIVGLGMGTLHLRSIKNHCRNGEVVALCDADEAKLRARQLEYDVPEVYTDLDRMLSQASLDGVILVVPNDLHAPMTLRCLQAGLHVLCEKPMALNAREAATMRDAAKKARRHLLINFNQRFGPEAWALKRAITEGSLGDIYAAKCGWVRRRGIPGLGGWFTTRKRSGGGALVDIGVHALDLTLWFMGHPKCTEAVASTYAVFGSQLAKTTGKNFDVDDLAMGLVKFDNGATLFLEASWASHIRFEAFYSELLGTEGGALRRWDREKNFTSIFRDENGSQVDKQIVQSTEPVPNSMQHFIDVLRDGVQPIPTAEDGVRVMAVLDALNASAGKARTGLNSPRKKKPAR